MDASWFDPALAEHLSMVVLADNKVSRVDYILDEKREADAVISISPDGRSEPFDHL